MKTFLAFVGGAVLTLAILAAFSVGHFVIMYGPTPITCVKAPK